VIQGRLSDVASELHAELTGEDSAFLGVTTDSRNVEAGQLFVALQGPRFDGHDFLEQAASRGVAGAIVSRPGAASIPLIRVANTLRALGSLAGHWRRRFTLPVIGVTGSAGKTTVKEMVAAILRQRGAVLATAGNLNNEIGVPLTLFGLAQRHRYAVIEMGANHPGEIGRLCSIVAPEIGLVTLAGASHLEGFGTIEGVARGKGEMFECMPPSGTAIINVDDCYADLWRKMAAPRRVVTFGLGPGADYTARMLRQSEDGGALMFRFQGPQGDAAIRLPLAGRHNVVNALAAAAAALTAGATVDDVRAGLALTRAVAGRMQMLRAASGAQVIDDTYNANPRSVRAALDFLCTLEGRPWAVLGDMGELGEKADRLHREIGEYARSVGIQRLFALGAHSLHTVRGFGAGAAHFDDVGTLVEALRAALGGDVNLLIKGSRMMLMETVVDQLVAPESRTAANGGR
jgi:UDP-N-acetylmuramoyl-tripeptide--D-alanyl-D-alanine ligase